MEGDTVQTPRGTGVVLKRVGMRVRVAHEESVGTSWVEVKDIQAVHGQAATPAQQDGVPSGTDVVTIDAGPSNSAEPSQPQPAILPPPDEAAAEEPPPAFASPPLVEQQLAEEPRQHHHRRRPPMRR